jgi:hypothetical protein
MTERTKDKETTRDLNKESGNETEEKLSRRAFAMKSVAAGAAAVAIPGVMYAGQQSGADAGSVRTRPGATRTVGSAQ